MSTLLSEHAKLTHPLYQSGDEPFFIIRKCKSASKMYIVITLGIFAVILAATEKIFLFNHGLKISFILIFLFTALRYNFGTDYLGYYQNFIDIGHYASISKIDFYMFRDEKGWCILTYLFQPIGFFGFIILISAFLCYTYYSLIKKYVDPKYYWLAVFVYVFSSDIMWIQFSGIRQAVAIAIFINSIKYLDDKKNPVMYILFNTVAGLLHTSAFFMLPFVLLTFKKIKRSKLVGIMIFIVFWGLLVWGKDIIPELIFITEFFSGERYLSRFDIEVIHTTTLIGSIAWGTLICIVLYYSLYQKKNRKYLFYLCSIYFLVYVLTPLFWLSGRMGYYFAPFSIIVYTLITKNEKNILIRYGVCAIFLISIVYRLSNFFTLDWVIQGYAKYQTIFSVL